MPRCPSCFQAMTRVENDGLKWCSCSNCFGTWISNIALLRRLRNDVAAVQGGQDEVSLADLAQTVSVANTKVALHCPACEKPMTKDRMHPMIPIQIDRCKACGYVWLDAGELELMRRLYAELMSSDDPEIVRRREKVAAVMTQWDARKTSTMHDMPPDGELGTIIQGGVDILSFFLTGRW